MPKEKKINEKKNIEEIKKSKVNEKSKETKESIESKETKENKPPKFKFECTRCGKCCQDRAAIPITFNDLSRWTKQGTFMSIILPHLDLRGVSEDDELGKIALIPLIKMKDENEKGKGICPFYDSENKMCNIYFSIPIYCKTFPLSYNGQKFYVSDPTCEGIGKGEMTNEKLAEMRQFATRDFEERSDTTIAMIPLQGLFIKHFMKQSQDTIDKLSKEDKDALDQLLKKAHPPEDKKDNAN